MKGIFSAILFGILCCYSGYSQQMPKDPVYSQSEVDKKAEIIKRPGASTQGKCSGSGNVRISVVLMKTGLADYAEIIRPSSCASFDNNALKAALKIKFSPAVKNSEQVNQRLLLEYSYRIF